MPSILDFGERQALAHGTLVKPALCVDALFDEQDHAALLRLIPSFEDPRPELQIVTFRNAYLQIGPGCDGVVVAEDGGLIAETARFCPTYTGRSADDLRRAAIDVDEDWVTVVDGAWNNYYHLLLLAIPKLYLAQRHAPFSRVVVPRRSSPDGSHKVDPSLLEHVLEVAGFGSVALRLEDGVYRVRNLRVVWTNYTRAAFLHVFEEPFRALDSLCSSVTEKPESQTPHRIFIQRAQNSRLDDPVVVDALDEQLDRYRFTRMRPELLSFEDQVRLFRHATHVVAAHGAGLSNIVFANSNLRLLELNSDIDGQGFFRPWFLLLANGKGMRYNYLNATPGELSRQRIRDAFERFMATPARAGSDL